jgi:polyhydroxyalkanoate synthesis regulator phasin
MYMKKRVSELLEDLKQSGKISTEEAKKYYEKYIPEDLQKKFNETKKDVSGEDEYVKKEDFNKILEKLEKIEQRLSKEEAE